MQENAVDHSDLARRETVNRENNILIPPPVIAPRVAGRKRLLHRNRKLPPLLRKVHIGLHHVLVVAVREIVGKALEQRLAQSPTFPLSCGEVGMHQRGMAERHGQRWRKDINLMPHEIPGVKALLHLQGSHIDFRVLLRPDLTALETTKRRIREDKLITRHRLPENHVSLDSVCLVVCSVQVKDRGGAGNLVVRRIQHTLDIPQPNISRMLQVVVLDKLPTPDTGVLHKLVVRKQVHISLPVADRGHQVQELAERVDVIPWERHLRKRLVPVNVPDVIGQLGINFPINSLQREKLGNAGGFEGLAGEVLEVGRINVVLAEAVSPVLRLEFLLLGVEEGQEFAITDEVPDSRDKIRQYFFLIYKCARLPREVAVQMETANKRNKGCLTPRARTFGSPRRPPTYWDRPTRRMSSTHFRG